MTLEDTVLSEISQRQKDKHYMIAFISGILKIKLVEQKAEWWEGGIWRYWSKGTSFQL